jgi:fructosamine-3-kinase
MFDAECNGLNRLRSAGAIRIPEPLQVGTAEDLSFLLIEFIEQGKRQAGFFERFAHELADLHGMTATQYGLASDNYIGSLVQSNKRHVDWHTFFIEERLKPQVELALANNLLDLAFARKVEDLYEKLPDLLPADQPALLHGDLWSGNFMYDEQGAPCLVDPAIHFGNRETEIAFSRMFGGFEPDFYHAYQEAWPLQPGFEDRVDLLNLYPLLVHVNLFGGNYARSAAAIVSHYV